jgi:predicted unusual protein kinase regulating ubiquinone biosynthesis (AarF/ABC1/UbiB family)
MDNRASGVPSTRVSRLARLGTLATGIAAGMVAEGVRQLSKGKRPKVSDLLLTPANVRRLGNQLAQMRGAAMKVGQLLSMDAGDLLPREFSDLLASLRADARAMPRRQLLKVLGANWGRGWQDRFERFDDEPVASASIGQVHAARTKDGRRLAIKVQYPGVSRSVSSDVDNVAALLRISGLLPPGLDLRPVLEEAKRQLREEADYMREGEQLARFRRLLAGDRDLLLPEVYPDLTTRGILAMSFVESVPLESLQAARQAERDRVVALLLGLMFREIFDFRLVQTDPNFANYRYDPGSRRLVLLDFGATRAYPKAQVEAHRRLFTGGARRDRHAVEAAAADIGYFGAGMDARQRREVVELVIQACEPLRHGGAYDFGGSDLPARMRDAGLTLGAEKPFWRSPPADVLFLYRKIGGMYLLAARLRARVDIRALFEPHAGTGNGLPHAGRR